MTKKCSKALKSLHFGRAATPLLRSQMPRLAQPEGRFCSAKCRSWLWQKAGFAVPGAAPASAGPCLLREKVIGLEGFQRSLKGLSANAKRSFTAR